MYFFNRQSKGSFSILAAFGFFMALLFLVFLFDVGQKFFDESRLNDVADFAAQSAVKKLDGSNQGILLAKNEVLTIFRANGFDVTNVESIVAGTVVNNIFTTCNPQQANALKITAKKTNSSILMSTISPLLGTNKYVVNGYAGASVLKTQEFPTSMISDNIAIDIAMIKNNNNTQCNNSFIVSTQPIQACHGPELQDLIFKRMLNFKDLKNAKTEVGQIVELSDMKSADFASIVQFQKNEYKVEKIIPVYAIEYDYYSYSRRPTIVGYTRLTFEKLNNTDFSVQISCGSNRLESSNIIKLSKDSKNNFGLFRENVQSKLIKI